MKKRIEEDDVIYIIEKNSGDCIDEFGGNAKY